MPLVLTRIDDRLIHGQVVVGWGSYLKPNRIILCSDSIAKTPWQKDIYRTAGTIAPYEVNISIWTIEETIDYFKNEKHNNEKAILLVESPRELLYLVENGAPIDCVNIGGMHFRHGKRQLAPYIFVDDTDLNFLKRLKDKNIKLEGQDVPTSKKIDVNNAIELI